MPASVSAMRADRIVGIITAAGRPLTVSELADAFYAYDRDGGPLNAEAIMRASVHSMRQRGDERIATTLAGYVLSSWPERPEWHEGRRVWDPRMLDHVERLSRLGLTYELIAERLGRTSNYISVALSKSGRTRRRAA